MRKDFNHSLASEDVIKLHQIFLGSWKTTKSAACDEKMSLLLISKQVGYEALNVLYGDNIFQKLLHENGGLCLLNHLSEANRHRIRKIQIVLQPLGCLHGRTLDFTLWSPIFARLMKLTIVAQNPSEAPEFYRVPTSEQAMQQWMAWARSVLQYIVPQLSTSCIIEVDDGDRKETSALMKDCLPTGYRGVHTSEGDIFFLRRFKFDAYPVIEDDCNNV